MLLNNKHYYNLPPEERKNLWKHYKKVYPNMGYTDMVKHFNGEVENYQFGGRTDYFNSDVKKYEDGGEDKPKLNSKTFSKLAANIPKNRLEAEAKEEYKRMHPEIEAANFYNKIQKNIEQTSEIYQTGPNKSKPTGKGALEPSYPEMMLMPGSLPIKAASKLGKAAVFAAEALNPIGGMKEIIKPKVLKTINNIKKIKTKTDDFIYETKYKKQIESIPEIKYQLTQEINTPEGYKRLRKQGIDPKSFINQLNKTSVTTKRNQGSWDDSMSINIDFNQLSDLKKQGYNLDLKTVLDHEIGHRMQRGFNSKAVKEYNKAKSYNYRMKVPEYIVYSTPLDIKSAESLAPLTKNMKQQDADYFFQGTEHHERLPFLRETKREMKNKGYINNIYDEITPEITKKFLNENPGNRFAKFLEINQPLTHNRLSSLLNKTPIIAGATVVTNKLNEK